MSLKLLEEYCLWSAYVSKVVRGVYGLHMSLKLLEEYCLWSAYVSKVVRGVLFMVGICL